MIDTRTPKDLFNEFVEYDLLEDRRECDAEDFMNAYPHLTESEAEELELMLQEWYYS
jgi:hypothetical protein